MHAAVVEGCAEGSCGEGELPDIGLHEPRGPVLTGRDREGFDRQIDPDGCGAARREEADLGPRAAAEVEDPASGRDPSVLDRVGELGRRHRQMPIAALAGGVLVRQRV